MRQDDVVVLIIERSIHIARDIDDVFAFVSDPTNDVIWCPKVRSVEQVSGGSPAPGARYAVVHRPIPVLPSRHMQHELVNWDPPHRVSWHEDDGHDQIAVSYFLAASGSGTTFTQRDDAQVSAPRVLHPVMRAGIGHDVAAQLKRLKRHLELAV